MIVVLAEDNDLCSKNPLSSQNVLDLEIERKAAIKVRISFLSMYSEALSFQCQRDHRDTNPLNPMLVSILMH